MDLDQVKTATRDLPLGDIRFFNEIGSTNDESRQWAVDGASDFSLVLADAQTTGRGRNGRKWYSPAGSSLAFSLVMYPPGAEDGNLSRWTALGALAVTEALKKHFGVFAQIKWPNDVLVNQRKLGGILTEAYWEGDRIQTIIIGVGINVARESDIMANQLAPGSAIPATSIEAIIGKPVDRLDLLKWILGEIVIWRSQIATHAFLTAWEKSLAYQGEWVQVIGEVKDQARKESLPPWVEPPYSIQAEGLIVGLAENGSLRLQTAAGSEVTINAGEIHLRPAIPAPKEHQVI